MFSWFAIAWLCGSLALIAIIVAGRRRRGALARELHELRGALTAARLAVDLMPVLDLDRPSVCRAASDELARTYQSLGEFEDLLHAKLIQPPFSRGELGAGAARIARRPRLDARAELERLALIWGEAARREGRALRFEWIGPDEGVFANGPQRRFVEVVANLLANAIRHGEGTIELTARMRSDTLRIEVRDDGPGLGRPLRTLARRGPSRAHGHGLSIALASARRLGGSLTSAPALQGAAVVFSVPAVHDPSSVPVRERAVRE
jgi:signal transduction histidine kinase